MPQNTGNTRDYNSEKVIEAIIVKAMPDRLVVRLRDDNCIGLIRKDGLPRQYHSMDCRRIAPVDSKVRATIIGQDERENYLLLRLIAVQQDSWQEWEKRHQVGDTVRSQVYNVTSYGAFAELEPGISGLIHFSEIPGAVEGEVGQMLWVGDFVEVEIVGIDPKERKIDLSICRHLDRVNEYRETLINNQKDREFSFRSMPRDAATASVQDTPDHVTAYPVASPGIVRGFLLIDDDDRFLASCSRWLSRLGYQVETAREGEEGILKAQEQSFDLILVDFNMPSMRGPKVAQRILELDPQANIALITGLEQGIREGDDFSEIDVVAVLNKLDGPSAIEKLIFRLEVGEEIEALPSHHNERGPQEDWAFLEEMPELTAIGRHCDLKMVLERILQRLRKASGAQSCLVFDMEPVSQKVSIVAHAGLLPSSSSDLGELRFSPVKDVIRGGQTIREDMAQANEPRFRHLLCVFDFNSCVAFPIKVSEQPRRYGLFMFHPSTQRFSNAHVRRAWVAAQSLALTIEKHAAESQMMDFQKFALAGQLTAAMIYEINNQIWQVEECARNLKEDCLDLSRVPECINNEGFRSEMDTSVEGILETVQEFRELAKHFLGLMTSGRLQTVDLNALLEQSIDLARPSAAPAQVFLKTHFLSDLPLVVGVASRLQQAFLNIVLNAIQQIEGNDSQGGLLAIHTFTRSVDETHPIKVRFLDTGPGIHRRNFERVFERGFSTRNGPGLGLFITRGLIESMGGRVFVEDSIMFIGTSFLVEFPATVGNNE